MDLTKQVGGDHYKNMAVQPLEVMESVLTREEFIGYMKGNIIKYSMRCGHKNGTDDEAKARDYMVRLKQVMGG